MAGECIGEWLSPFEFDIIPSYSIISLRCAAPSPAAPSRTRGFYPPSQRFPSEAEVHVSVSELRPNLDERHVRWWFLIVAPLGLRELYTPKFERSQTRRSATFSYHVSNRSFIIDGDITPYTPSEKCTSDEGFPVSQIRVIP